MRERSRIDFEALSKAIDEGLTGLVSRRDFPEQPDARAFGAYVEQAVLADWPALCADLGVTAREPPGRRTIYDASFEVEGKLVGVDFRTKDLADDRYSDGGICAVANLLRFMVGGKATLLITEFGYSIHDGVAVFSYVRTAPVHGLPSDTYRIENLGTGQLRFNASILECHDRVAWDRTIPEFFADFAPLCIEHYRRVKQRAEHRIKAIEAFVESNYGRITLK